MPNILASFHCGAGRAVRSLLPTLAILGLAAACGGGDGPPTGPGGGGGGGTSTVRVDVAAQFVVATTTTGLTLRVTPAYELTAGGTTPLAATTAAVTSTAAQTIPVTLDITPCLANAARSGVNQGTGANAVCRLVVEYALLSGSRVVETQSFGTYTVRAGTVTSQAVTFSEVTGVQVTMSDGTVLADGAAARVEVGATLPLRATALRADGSAYAARPVQWTSESPAVATVNAATGDVTPVAPGQARIVATAAGLQSGVAVTVAPRTAALTIAAAAGVGTGTITSAPAGVDCRVSAGVASGPSCSANFAADPPVTLTATPDATSQFIGWGGACSGTGTTCTVTLDQARNVTAAFARRRVTITLQASGPAAGTLTATGTGVTNGVCATTGSTVTCAATADIGTAVTINAAPGPVSAVGDWTGGACSGAATVPCALTVNGDVTVGAAFAAIPTTPTPVPFGISVFSTNGARFVADLVFERRLNGQQANSGNITFALGTDLPQPVLPLDADAGTTVKLTVRAKAGGRIVSWGGVCEGSPGTSTSLTATSCIFTAAPNASVIVNLGPQ